MDGNESRTTTRRLALVLAILAVAVYANSLTNGFAFDDVPIVLENERAHGVDKVGEAVTSQYWPMAPSRWALYRPVTVAMYAVEWDLWNGSPLGYHAVNVLLHAAVTVLVLLLLLRLGTAPAAAAAGAAVFAVHPVHVEAVANVVGRAELLAAAFYLAAVLLYLRPGVRPAVRAAGIGAAYLLGLGAKEIAVTLPGTLLLLEIARGDRGGRVLDRVRREWPVGLALTLALAVFIGMRYHALGRFIGNDTAAFLAPLSTGERVLTAIRIWPEYARLLFYPADLVADYSPAVLMPAHGMEPMVILGLVLGAAAAVAAIAAWHRARPVSLGIAWFAITVFPVSNLAVPIGVLLAERTLYLPSVGLALGIAGVAGALRARGARSAATAPVPSRVAAAAFLVILAAAGGRSWLRNPVWRSDATVIRDLVETHPESYRVQWALATGLVGQGRLEESLEYFERAVELVPDHQLLLIDYGRALYGLGRWDDAADALAGALSNVPEHRDSNLLLGNALLRAGRAREAVEALERATRLFSEDAALHDQAAHAYAAVGDWRAALRMRRAALRLQGEDAGWPSWLNLAYIQAHLEDEAGVREALEHARAAAPDSVDVPSLDAFLESVAAARASGAGGSR